MEKFIRYFLLSALAGLLLQSCNLARSTSGNPFQSLSQPTPSLSQVVTIQLAVQVDPPGAFNQFGQNIIYSYSIKNIGGTSVPATVSVSGVEIKCPDMNTVGNHDTVLDGGETLVCTSTHTITQADLDQGQVTNIATADVSGVKSNQVTTTTPVGPNKLVLAKTANPLAYNAAGQQIVFTYVIKNSGGAPLGPTQFTVNDAGIGAAFPCGDPNVTLAPNATLTCNANYVITQADLGAASILSSATASGGGIGPSGPAVVNLARSSAPPSNPGNFTAGTTIQHRVVLGEWLWQIARCYGADPRQVIQANPQLRDPGQIVPDTTLSVPNIGSAGAIYGPPCVVMYTVKSGDTWSSIAQQYSADVSILQQVNPGGLSGQIRVPPHSAGSTVSSPPTPAVNAVRINFVAGSTSATLTGTALSGNRPSHYVLNAKHGQLLTIKLTAPTGSVGATVLSPNGGTVKAVDQSLLWSGVLPADGDYRLDVVNVAGLGAADTPYTLQVSVTGP